MDFDMTGSFVRWVCVLLIGITVRHTGYPRKSKNKVFSVDFSVLPSTLRVGGKAPRRGLCSTSQSDDDENDDDDDDPKGHQTSTVQRCFPPPSVRDSTRTR